MKGAFVRARLLVLLLLLLLFLSSSKIDEYKTHVQIIFSEMQNKLKLNPTEIQLGFEDNLVYGAVYDSVGNKPEIKIDPIIFKIPRCRINCVIIP